jgi:hypothetical protein
MNIKEETKMLNLSKDDMRLLLCALQEAVTYNKHLLEDGENLEEDDKESCRIALEDYDTIHKKIRVEWQNKVKNR